MAHTVREIMSKEPVVLDHSQSAAAAAVEMRNRDVGNVLVTKNDTFCGIVTDRDLVVRCLADGADPKSTKLDSLCSKDVVTLAPDAAVDEAVKLMRQRSIRRVPIVEKSRPVGVVSIGDLARELDGDSALSEISAAQPNR